MRRREALAALLSATAARASTAGAAAVLLDARTGRALAIRNEKVARRGSMPPGSTMKPLALAALLKSGKLREQEAFLCPGTLRIGGRQLNCSHPRVTTPMRVETALAYSCNCFVARMAERLGPGELPGAPRVAGADAIRLQALGEAGVSFTAVELAEAYRVLALNAPEAIAAGLEGAVEYGTAQRAQIAGVKVAGKTGSVRAASGARIAWFAGWMPSRAPKVVVAVMLQGLSGGADAAPVAREILETRQ
jgi:cell division protein FtsI/penicillin-binding protein 2